MSSLLIQAREPIELPNELMLWLRTFAEFASEARMGLHCSICKQDLVGGAAFYGDLKLTMKCGCRDFVGVDPVMLLKKRESEALAEKLKSGAADLPVQ